MATIENCKIRSTELGYCDRGILTCWIHLEGHGWGVGFGGFGLDEWSKEHEERIPCAVSMKAITKILKTLDVNNWENLKGQFLRCEVEGPGGKCLRIGHLMKDQWFSFEDFFEKAKKDGELPCQP